MSTLDHNLICGDSLTGIGTVAEALDVLDPNRGEAQRSLFSRPIEKAMAAAAKALGAVAAAWEADTAEVQRNRQALKDAKARAEPARRLFDAAVALRLGLAEAKPGSGVDAIAGVADEPEAKAEIERMQPVHMPLRFPQVFQRQEPGFDVLIGNPPWEKAKVEEDGWWAVRFPGLKSLHQKKQRAGISCLRKDRPDLVAEYEAELSRAESQRQALMAGPFPGMETGDPDLYKAFCWRFWDLARDGGAIGVVLPRSALSTKGSAKWRQAVLDGGTFADVTLLLNKGRWVFDMEPRYSVGLITQRKGDRHRGTLQLRGPYDSRETCETGMATEPAVIPVDEFLTWTNAAALPSIPSDDALRVFRKMRRHPRLDLRPRAGSASSATTIHDPRSTIHGLRRAA